MIIPGENKDKWNCLFLQILFDGKTFRLPSAFNSLDLIKKVNNVSMTGQQAFMKRSSPAHCFDDLVP